MKSKVQLREWLESLARHIEDFNAMAKAVGESLKLHFHARDLIPTLVALTEQEIVGNVQIAASEHALVFSYRTEITDYSIAIPTTKQNGTRNKQAFASVGDA